MFNRKFPLLLQPSLINGLNLLISLMMKRKSLNHHPGPELTGKITQGCVVSLIKLTPLKHDKAWSTNGREPLVDGDVVRIQTYDDANLKQVSWGSIFETSSNSTLFNVWI